MNPNADWSAFERRAVQAAEAMEGFGKRRTFRRAVLDNVSLTALAMGVEYARDEVDPVPIVPTADQISAILLPRLQPSAETARSFAIALSQAVANAAALRADPDAAAVVVATNAGKPMAVVAA